MIDGHEIDMTDLGEGGWGAGEVGGKGGCLQHPQARDLDIAC